MTYMQLPAYPVDPDGVFSRIYVRVYTRLLLPGNARHVDAYA